MKKTLRTTVLDQLALIHFAIKHKIRHFQLSGEEGCDIYPTERQIWYASHFTIKFRHWSGAFSKKCLFCLVITLPKKPVVETILS